MKYNEYIDLVNSIDVRVDYQHKLGCIYVKGNLYGCPFEIENLCHYTFTLNGVPLGLLITKHNNNKVEVKVEVIGKNNMDVYGEVLVPIYKNAEITSIPFDKEVFENKLKEELDKYNTVQSMLSNDIVTFLKRTNKLFKYSAVIEDTVDSMCGGIVVVGVLNGYAIFDSNKQFDNEDEFIKGVDIEEYKEQGLASPIEELDNETVIRLYLAYLGIDVG